jgi:two-component system, sensor histidine kinase and response regulator
MAGLTEQTDKRDPTVEREQQTLERLSVALEVSGIACWQFSYDVGGITWLANPPANMCEPHESMEQIAARLGANIHPDDSLAMRKATEQALAAGLETMSMRVRSFDKNHSLRHIVIYQKFFRNAEGVPTHAIGGTRDITDEVETAARLQQQAEELADAKRRLERASLSVLEGHWEIDLSTMKHWASSNYYALLGYTPDEIDLSTAARAGQLVHPDDRQHSIQIAYLHIETGTPYEVELRVAVKGGGYRWFRLRGNAQRDANGRVTHLSGSLQDIHKQRLAEEELQRTRQRLERAIRGTQDGLWEWDLNTGSLWASPRYEAILRYREGELLRMGRGWDDLIHMEDREAVAAAQRAHFELNVPFDVEVRMCTNDGEFRWIRIRGEAERDAAGTPVRVSGSIQDVNDARATRDAILRASEAAQEANRAKSAFLANMSHEIRTPMNGIVGMTSLLLDTSLEGSQREYAETIRSSADSLLRVINDILDFSKIEAGKLDIESIDMSLPATVDDMRAIMSFQAAAKQLKFSVHIDPAAPRTVRGDPQRIRQCLINLVGNAIKFTQRGEVSIEIRAVGQRDGCVLTQFEVHDTGIGIPEHAQKALFQPFSQADSSTTRHYGGTGLGLSIVRRLVEMMGGEIGLRSEAGQGSTFWFVLPMQPVAPALPASEELTRQRPMLTKRYRATVLLVEDNVVNQKVACRFLERLGCEVTVVENGLEAVRAWESSPPDLILMDVQMPVMDGYTATREIRSKESPRARAPIIALTANALAGQLERCHEAGMDGLLTKPLDREQLQALLERLGFAEPHAA